jgi:hypothetical protein
VTGFQVSYCRTENWVKIEDALIIMAGEDDYKSPMEDADVACEVESNLIKRKASSSWCDVGANLPDYLNVGHVSRDNHQSIKHFHHYLGFTTRYSARAVQRRGEQVVGRT